MLRVSINNSLYKKSLQIPAPAQFLQIDILIFQRTKGTEQKKKKNERPRIEPVPRQNKFERGTFSALPAYANEALVRELSYYSDFIA